MNVTQFSINLATYACPVSLLLTLNCGELFVADSTKTLPMQMERMYQVTRRDSAKFAAISGKATHGFSL